MTPEETRIMDTLHKLIEAVYKQDVRTYRDLVIDEISSIEPEITPYRIDSIEFHINLMSQRAKRVKAPSRTDILTPRIQLYGNFAIVTYTLLITQPGEEDVRFNSCNETRVFIKEDDRWKMAHLHRSPT